MGTSATRRGFCPKDCSRSNFGRDRSSLELLKAPLPPEACAEVLIIINIYTNGCQSGKTLLKEQGNLLRNISSILEKHTNNYNIKLLCLRVLKNSLKEGIVRTEDFLLEVVGA